MKKMLTALALIAALFPCSAEEAKKQWTVDMTTPLFDEAGVPIKDGFNRNPTENKADPDCSNCPQLTVGDAVAHALFFIQQGESVTPEQKWSWAILAEKVRKDKAAALNAAQADLIYKRLGILYSGAILMKAMPLIDPNRQPPEVK